MQTTSPQEATDMQATVQRKKKSALE
ncbi:hypothetical protein GA0115255_109041, partial [Streptomyces sp. Ncost-T6T-2b]